MKKIRYCGNCGELLDEGAKFCRECGAPVLTDSEKTVQDISDPYGMNWQDVDQVTQTLGLGAEQNRETAGQDYPFDQMPGEKNQKNLNRDRLFIIIAGVILAILVVILVFLIYRRMSPSSGETDNTENAGNITTVTQSQDDTDEVAIDSGNAGEKQEKTISEEDTAFGEDTADDSNENTSGSNVTDTDESDSGNTAMKSDGSQEGTDSEDGNRKSETPDSGYILPDSAGRIYSRSEIEALTDTELLYALNEIYARHGRIFMDEQIRNYFESQSWYHGTVSGESFDPMQDQIFNTYEKQNRDLIVDVMEERGLR